MVLLEENCSQASQANPDFRATLATRVAASAFTRPMRIGKRRVARVQSEVSDWLAARAEERGSVRLAEPTSTNEALQKGKAI
jgi:hypothetical protein